MHALFCYGVTLYNVFVKVSKSEVCVQDIPLWNSIVDGYFKFGCFEDVSLLLGNGHRYIVRNVFMWDAFLESALIDMYMYAWRVFDKLEDKSSIVVRNVMIGGFCEDGMWEKSFELYCQAKKDNCKLGSATFSNVIMVSSHADNLKFGMKVHCNVMKFGFEWEPYVCTSLVTMYGSLVYVWNAVFCIEMDLLNNVVQSILMILVEELEIPVLFS
ncbi:hypothetical protein IFM89_036747 [Coptis chinensis]|uniref:Pentatricopeptide repeat-containing protein n=1 Tax=Coptis chinensis TaxID=261450 RepID=A0A835LU68_9MAGN|nr:hypothetical protein IFM89_036747 [Coptis chinensis]